MTNNSIIEAFFKALGWTYDVFGNSYSWIDPKGKYFKELPNILESFSAFKEHVLEVMGEEGFYLKTMVNFIQWDTKINYDYRCFGEELIDNNILHAAVIAATRYFEEKK